MEIEKLVQQNRLSIGRYTLGSIQIGLGNIFDIVIVTIFIIILVTK
jgi:hypothetical protein